MCLKILRTILFIFFLLSTSFGAWAQCVVASELTPAGNLIEKTNPSVLFYNQHRQVQSEILYDGANLLLILVTLPVSKDEMNPGGLQIITKQGDTLQMELDGKVYHPKDSSMDAMYVINEAQEKILKMEHQHENKMILASDIVKLSGDFADGNKEFILKLHQALIREQIACIREKSR